MEQSKITLALEDTNLIQTLYHELGHSFHGAYGGFAAYFDVNRLRKVLHKHADFFSKENLNLQDLENNPGAVMWKVFQYLYDQKFIQWKKFNEDIGITDLNTPFKDRGDNQIEEKYGISAFVEPDEANKPSIAMEYILICL